jgi:dTDP-4-amino-4,6-dideoxygalactose transaminase
VTGDVRPEPFPDPLHLTRPLLPSLARYVTYLEAVWKTGWLTNGAEFHGRLEMALGDRFPTGYVSLWNNGTTALMGALRGLDISQQVIVTPFTFPATVHALDWMGLEPVFVDVDPVTLTIDPDQVADAASARTSAVVGVHVYGLWCDTDAIAGVARRHGLRVIYDAAHAFGNSAERFRGDGVGDATMFSFHATKIFHAAEGGALLTEDPALSERVKLLRNFGIASEDEVTDVGINGKMNELQAALGLLVLEEIESEMARRQQVARWYREGLAAIEGITSIGAEDAESHQYLAVRVDPVAFGKSRDDLFDVLRSYNVMARRYFSPLCSHLDRYRDLPSAHAENLPNAERAARECLVLPFHGQLQAAEVERVCAVIRHVQHSI